jgi:aminopeptidase-like protein
VADSGTKPIGQPDRPSSPSQTDDRQRALYAHVETLFPLCRSITGQGLRETLRYIAAYIPLEISEVPSGTPVLDWEVPLEWNVRAGRLRALDGRTIADFARNNLHLVQYSQPVDRVVPRDELERHLISLPAQPDLVPYRTGYYANDWGFCLADRVRQSLTDDAYHVEIDTTLIPGSLSYGECLIRGETSDEMLFSIHSCHPSLANDNLSGIAVAIELARELARRPRRRFSYRFIFAPGTIGAITWLHRNRETVQRIRHGLVLSNLGDQALPTYKQSRRGNAPIDRYAAYILGEEGHAERIRPFIPYGYDERQYCSPGFNLPVGCLMRSPSGTFPEYHTSADNLDFVKPEALVDSLRIVTRLVDMVENDRVWRNLSPHGEPQLGRRGLYGKIGGVPGNPSGGAGGLDQMAILWLLNLADGEHSLLDIAERSGKSFDSLVAAASALNDVGLLAAAESAAGGQGA